MCHFLSRRSFWELIAKKCSKLVCQPVCQNGIADILVLGLQNAITLGQQGIHALTILIDLRIVMLAKILNAYAQRRNAHINPESHSCRSVENGCFFWACFNLIVELQILNRRPTKLEWQAREQEQIDFLG